MYLRNLGHVHLWFYGKGFKRSKRMTHFRVRVEILQLWTQWDDEFVFTDLPVKINELSLD